MSVIAWLFLSTYVRKVGHWVRRCPQYTVLYRSNSEAVSVIYCEPVLIRQSKVRLGNGLYRLSMLQSRSYRRSRRCQRRREEYNCELLPVGVHKCDTLPNWRLVVTNVSDLHRDDLVRLNLISFPCSRYV